MSKPGEFWQVEIRELANSLSISGCDQHAAVAKRLGEISQSMTQAVENRRWLDATFTTEEVRNLISEVLWEYWRTLSEENSARISKMAADNFCKRLNEHFTTIAKNKHHER